MALQCLHPNTFKTQKALLVVFGISKNVNNKIGMINWRKPSEGKATEIHTIWFAPYIIFALSSFQYTEHLTQADVNKIQARPAHICKLVKRNTPKQQQTILKRP